MANGDCCMAETNRKWENNFSPRKKFLKDTKAIRMPFCMQRPSSTLLFSLFQQNSKTGMTRGFDIF